ncbi:hypothetical protein SAMN05660473_03225 [Arthrobacter sp. 49Tsu3.1M3]|uniref:DUF6993 domain-containing protein n=1 Tax=Arthrobacter sp. 49Tsu3.1M3 TaxID=1279029 RepID=UPI0009D585CC|nr:hypothetical protein [Arthrobacter sp. 49Tsu3.1M3]SKB95250.1 hypothetical protein SAMN05660473_03225 [Arthrobacter sp. 49Tsu3.1M3]
MQHARIAAGRAAPITAAGGAARRGGWAVPAAATLVLLLSASACATPAGSSGALASEAADSEGPPSAASPAPAASTSTPAKPGLKHDGVSAMRTTVEAVLNAAIRDGGQPETAGIRASLVDAGIPADAVEVTAGRTPTGLAVDAVEAGVRDGSSCIVAQVRAGSVAVTVLPGLASGGCLLGVRD